jgi:hypothetical protein
VKMLIKRKQLRAFGTPATERVLVSSINEFLGIRPEPRPVHTETTIKGYVYVIRSGDYCKIGKSVDVLRRLKEISTSTPVAPEIVHTIPTNRMVRAENTIHAKFASKRARNEWFNLDDSDIAEVKTIEHLFF